MLTSTLQREPDFLLGEVRLRARSLEPVVLELLSSFALVLSNDDREWTLYQHRNGGNSFSLWDGNGREFHFRYWHQGFIHVKDSYMNGKLVAKIGSRKQARNFVKAIIK
jgi:hypothetical protein